MGSHEIDTVAMVRQIRDSLYEETKELSTEELIAFYRQHSRGARERLSQIRAERDGMSHLSRRMA